MQVEDKKNLSRATERLIALRKALGLNRRQFAEVVGYSPALQTKIESGERVLLERHIASLFDLFPLYRGWWDGDLPDDQMFTEEGFISRFRKELREKGMLTGAGTNDKAYEIADALKEKDAIIAELRADKRHLQKLHVWLMDELDTLKGKKLVSNREGHEAKVRHISTFQPAEQAAEGVAAAV